MSNCLKKKQKTKQKTKKKNREAIYFLCVFVTLVSSTEGDLPLLRCFSGAVKPSILPPNGCRYYN